jgi:hypothetical protein
MLESRIVCRGLGRSRPAKILIKLRIAFSQERPYHNLFFDFAFVTNLQLLKCVNPASCVVLWVDPNLQKSTRNLRSFEAHKDLIIFRFYTFYQVAVFKMRGSRIVRGGMDRSKPAKIHKKLKIVRNQQLIIFRFCISHQVAVFKIRESRIICRGLRRSRPAKIPRKLKIARSQERPHHNLFSDVTSFINLQSSKCVNPASCVVAWLDPNLQISTRN